MRVICTQENLGALWTNSTQGNGQTWVANLEKKFNTGYKCEWVPNSNSSNTICAKAYKMLPGWGYGRMYTMVVVNCTFSETPNYDNSGEKLTLYAYYSTSPKRYEKIVALEETPGSYNVSKFRPPFPYEYVYCGSSLYGNLSASHIHELMVYHVHFSSQKSHFVFHDAGGVSPAVRASLDPWIRAGRATLQDIRGQAEYDGYYYNQFLVVNDCLHKYRHAANWTFFFDMDEYIYLPDGRTLESVLTELLPYTQFTFEQNLFNCPRKETDLIFAISIAYFGLYTAYSRKLQIREPVYKYSIPREFTN